MKLFKKKKKEKEIPYEEFKKNVKTIIDNYDYEKIKENLFFNIPKFFIDEAEITITENVFKFNFSKKLIKKYLLNVNKPFYVKKPKIVTEEDLHNIIWCDMYHNLTNFNDFISVILEDKITLEDDEGYTFIYKYELKCNI